MVELMISAPASGSGKTVLTCALLAALKERQSAIERRENRAENLKEYKKRGQEL